MPVRCELQAGFINVAAPDCRHMAATLPALQGWAERAVFGKIRYMNYNVSGQCLSVDVCAARGALSDG